MDRRGAWRLSPAYDLCHAEGSEFTRNTPTQHQRQDQRLHPPGPGRSRRLRRAAARPPPESCSTKSSRRSSSGRPSPAISACRRPSPTTSPARCGCAGSDPPPPPGWPESLLAPGRTGSLVARSDHVKLIAFSTSNSPVRPGSLLDDRTVLDLTHPACGLPELNSNLDACDLAHPFLAAAAALTARATGGEHDRLRASGAVLARADVELHAPVPRPGKILCIGLNYRDHAEEQGAKLPERPLVFSKFATCVLAPGGTIVIPPGSTETDYEAELGVVIGRRASRVARSDAMNHVLGYCNFHDVSRARLPVRRRTVAARQGLRHVRAVRRVRRDDRRNPGPARARHPAAPQRQDHAGLEHQPAGVRHPGADRVPEHLHHARARRRDRDWHAPRCRVRAQAPRLPARRRRGRGSRSTASAYCATPSPPPTASVVRTDRWGIMREATAFLAGAP